MLDSNRQEILVTELISIFKPPKNRSLLYQPYVDKRIKRTLGGDMPSPNSLYNEQLDSSLIFFVSIACAGQLLDLSSTQTNLKLAISMFESFSKSHDREHSLYQKHELLLVLQIFLNRNSEKLSDVQISTNLSGTYDIFRRLIMLYYARLRNTSINHYLTACKLKLAAASEILEQSNPFLSAFRYLAGHDKSLIEDFGKSGVIYRGLFQYIEYLVHFQALVDEALALAPLFGSAIYSLERHWFEGLVKSTIRHQLTLDLNYEILFDDLRTKADERNALLEMLAQERYRRSSPYSRPVFEFVFGNRGGTELASIPVVAE